MFGVDKKVKMLAMCGGFNNLLTFRVIIRRIFLIIIIVIMYYIFLYII